MCLRGGRPQSTETKKRERHTFEKRNNNHKTRRHTRAYLDDSPVLSYEIAVLAVQVVDAPEVARLDLARGHDLEARRFVLRRRHGPL